MTIIESIDQLASEFPELIASLPYVYALESLVQNALKQKDMDMMRLLHGRIYTMLAAPDLPEDVRYIIIARILHHFLKTFETTEELRETSGVI